MKLFPLLSLCATALLLGGCSTFDRLSEIGREPTLSRIGNPTMQPGYRPVTMPMPEPEPVSYNANSLWVNGSRSFFKDQRASKVGDILTVLVEITDNAKFDNASTRTRTANKAMGVSHLGGLETIAKKMLPNTDMNNLVGFDSNTDSAGSGSVNRKENLTTKIAAVVTQKLPNGNLVIEGRQEVRVNEEVREMLIAGIVRPEDISAQNRIDISKIAEARVSYGGRGAISDVQKVPYGQQALDVVLPF